MPLEVLYEDNHLLIVNKEAGISTQETPHHPLSLETHCRNWLREVYHKPGNIFASPIHRLDQPVSGAVVFAKTSKALSRLQGSLRRQEMEKTYWGVVKGRIEKKEGTMTDFLLHGDRRAEIVTQETEGAKKAILTYRTLAYTNGYSLVNIRLCTGRYHQIRVQWASRGTPLLGDAKYGSRDRFYEEGIALHHRRLSFPHPVKNERLTIVAPLPPFWSLLPINWEEYA